MMLIAVIREKQPQTATTLVSAHKAVMLLLLLLL